jgi:hypothetical protein
MQKSQLGKLIRIFIKSFIQTWCMAVYSPMDYYLMIPKVVEVFCFFVSGLIIYRKQKYLLNHLFGIAMWSWAVYTSADFIIWTNAANSELWFQICNVIRDIQLFAGIVFAYLIYVVSELIEHSTSGLNRKVVFSVGLLFLVIGFVMVFQETLVIKGGDNVILTPDQWDSGEYVYVTTDMNILFIILMIFPLFLYFSAVNSLNNVKKNMKENTQKSKINKMIVGILLIPTGTIYFALIMTFGTGSEYTLFFLGRGIWIAASLFILSSQLDKKQK